MRNVRLLALLFVLLPSPLAAADLSISLPLGPYYRPGKYLPVRITAAVLEPGNYCVALAADNVGTRPTELSQGAGRTSVNLREGRIDAIVPWLGIDGRARRPRLFIQGPAEFVDGPELKRLGDSERMVGWTTPDQAFARQLLHGAPKII